MERAAASQEVQAKPATESKDDGSESSPASESITADGSDGASAQPPNNPKQIKRMELKWEDANRSRVALTTWLICCYWPWMTPLVIHILILRHIRSKHKDMQGSDADEMASPKSKKEHEEEHAATLGWLATVGHLMPSGTKEWLGGIQNTVGWAANLLDGIYGLFDWRDESTTKTIAIALCASLGLHSSFFSFGYTWALIGLFLFSVFTALYLDAMNLMNGYSTYSSVSFSKLAAKAAEQKGSDINAKEGSSPSKKHD